MSQWLDVNKAISYASAWATWNNDGNYYREGDDCTNFVSQCWHEGGIKMCSYWANDISRYIFTPAWAEVETFCYFMTTSSADLDPNADSMPIAKIVQEISTPLNDYTNIIQPGDIVQCYNADKGWHHSIIIMDLVNGMPRYCAHSSFANYMDLTVQFSSAADSPNSKIRIIRALNIIYNS